MALYFDVTVSIQFESETKKRRLLTLLLNKGFNFGPTRRPKFETSYNWNLNNWGTMWNCVEETTPTNRDSLEGDECGRESLELRGLEDSACTTIVMRTHRDPPKTWFKAFTAYYKLSATMLYSDRDSLYTELIKTKNGEQVLNKYIDYRISEL